MPVTTLTSSLFSSGNIGLYDFSEQTFDNFVLRDFATAAPEPTSLALAGFAGVAMSIGAWWRGRRRTAAQERLRLTD